MKVKCVCPICGNVNYVDVDEEEYNNYINGELVQRAFPNMDCTTRELLVTGTCPDCWDMMFCGEEEDDDCF